MKMKVMVSLLTEYQLGGDWETGFIVLLNLKKARYPGSLCLAINCPSAICPLPTVTLISKHNATGPHEEPHQTMPSPFQPGTVHHDDDYRGADHAQVGDGIREDQQDPGKNLSFKHYSDHPDSVHAS